MQIVKAGYWVLAALAGTGWIAFLSAAITLVVGNPSLTDNLAGLIARFDELAAWLGASLFAAFAIAQASLLPKIWRRSYRSLWFAMRGAPRWLGRAMITTLLLTAGGLVWMLFVSLFSAGTDFAPIWTLAMASAFAAACCQYVSAARLGLGTQRCKNGHPLARDMTRCSLCDAPARGVLLFTP